MNPEEAKIILHTWHKNADAEMTPEIRKALAMLESSPDLANWWMKEETFDQAITSALEDIPVPEDLMEKILSTAPHPTQPQSSRPSTRLLKFPRIMAWAASLIALFFVGLLVFDPLTVEAEPNLDQYYEHISLSMREFPRLEKTANSTRKLLRHLYSRKVTVPENLPARFSDLQPTGTHVQKWRGLRIGVIHMEDREGHSFRLFMIPAAALAQSINLPEEPTTREIDGVSVLAWENEGVLYALAADGSENLLVPYL